MVFAVQVMIVRLLLLVESGHQWSNLITHFQALFVLFGRFALV